jgi:hypothetical protein
MYYFYLIEKKYKIKNIDEIWKLVEGNIYFDFAKFDGHIRNMFSYVIDKKCKTTVRKLLIFLLILELTTIKSSH